MDLKELGIREEDKGSQKRMKAIVIDGTDAGILNRLPNMERNMLELRSINEDTGRVGGRLANRFVNTPSYRKVLEKILTTTREVLRSSLKHSRSGQARVARAIRFWLTNESGDVVGIEKPKATFTKLECRLLQLFCTENSCVCPEGPISGVLVRNHTDECQDIRTSFLEKIEAKEIMELLSQVFRITTGEQPSSLAVEENEQIVETETEPSADSDSSETSSENSSGSEPSAPVYTTAIGPVAHLLVHDAERNPQFAESFLSLLHLILFEHVAMPYLGRIPGQGEDCDSPSMLSFTNVSMELHENIAKCMKDLVHCTHSGMDAAISLQDDCECNAALRKAIMSMQDANPVLETFCVDLLKVRRPFSSRLGSLVESLARLMLKHREAAKDFFEGFETCCADDLRDYWKDYNLRDQSTAQNVVSDDVETGIWFPGRQQCRPGIMFNTRDARQCKKKYSKSQRHSAGLMTVQCACQSPKLLGFIIMTRAESVSLALSSLLTHFPILPRTIYYDNACNMFSSAVLRVPWIFRQTRMAVDRFHYKSHKCNSLFNPDSYSNFDAHRTETAESINARIEKSLPCMRYLGTESLLPFLRVRLSLVNLCALHQQKFSRSDLEDEDLTPFFQSVCACDCILCEAYDVEVKVDMIEERQQNGALPRNQASDQPTRNELSRGNQTFGVITPQSGTGNVLLNSNDHNSEHLTPGNETQDKRE